MYISDICKKLIKIVIQLLDLTYEPKFSSVCVVYAIIEYDIFTCIKNHKCCWYFFQVLL